MQTGRYTSTNAVHYNAGPEQRRHLKFQYRMMRSELLHGCCGKDKRREQRVSGCVLFHLSFSFAQFHLESRNRCDAIPYVLSDTMSTSIQHFVDRSSLQSSSSTTVELHTDLAHFLVQYLGASSPSDLSQYGIKTPIELVDIISRVRSSTSRVVPGSHCQTQFITNTFTLTDASLTPIGASISPLVALINHSCDPNAVVVFPQPGSMQVIAIREIAPGEEVQKLSFLSAGSYLTAV